jgi:hypothetical protein
VLHKSIEFVESLKSEEFMTAGSLLRLATR